MINTKWKYLKLDRKFFEDARIIVLGSMKNGVGEIAVLMYLKLLVEAINHEGYLNMGDGLKYTPETLSIKYHFGPKKGFSALEKMQELGLVEWVPLKPKTEHSGDVFVPFAMTMVGKDSEMADYRRRHRQEKAKNGEEEDSSLHDEGGGEDAGQGEHCSPNVHQKEESGEHCSPDVNFPFNPLESQESRDKKASVSVSVEQRNSTSTNTTATPTPLGKGPAEPAAKPFGKKSSEETAEGKATAFFSAYPLKSNFGAVSKWFRKHREVDASMFERMMSALEEQKASDGWKEQGGKFIPSPMKWLEGMRWLDDVNPKAPLRESPPEGEEATDEQVDQALSAFYKKSAEEAAEREFPGEEEPNRSLRIICMGEDSPDFLSQALERGATEEQINKANKIRRENLAR